MSLLDYAQLSCSLSLILSPHPKIVLPETPAWNFEQVQAWQLL